MIKPTLFAFTIQTINHFPPLDNLTLEYRSGSEECQRLRHSENSPTKGTKRAIQITHASHSGRSQSKEHERETGLGGQY